MFANITLVEAVSAILAIVGSIVAFLKGTDYLLKKTSKAFGKIVEANLEPTNQKISNLIADVEKVREQVCLTYYGNQEINCCCIYSLYCVDVRSDYIQC